MSSLTVFLAYPCLGKSYYISNYPKKGIEIPLSTFLNLKHYLVPLQNGRFDLLSHEEFTLILSKYYEFYLKELSSRFSDILFLGPGLPLGYQIFKCIPNIKIITLVPEETCLEDFKRRWIQRMEQNPKERDLQMFDNQLKSWATWHSYFEDISKEDPNIIFTKPGEYLTDYLDLETGEFKFPELLHF